MNISYLTKRLIDYVDAPMPYIIGIPRNLWKEIKKQRKAEDWLNDITIFDMDKKRLKTKEKLPDIPENYSRQLLQTLQQIMENKKNIQEPNNENEVTLLCINK